MATKTRSKTLKSSLSKLTVKQRKFIKYFIATGNASESARLAGYSLDHSGFENLRKPQVQRAYAELLEDAGLDDESLARKHKQLLEAKRVGGYLNNEFVEVDDNPTQLGALKLVYQITGKLNSADNSTNINIQNITIKECKDRLENINRAFAEGFV